MGVCPEIEACTVSVKLERDVQSILIQSFLPSFLMNIINQASVYLRGESKYDLIITVNITIMMVLASIYLSVSTSLSSTPRMKPVEIWLLFNLIYPFLVILINIIVQRLENTEHKAGRKERKLKICRMISELFNPFFYVLFSIIFFVYCFTIQ